MFVSTVIGFVATGVGVSACFMASAPGALYLVALGIMPAINEDSQRYVAFASDRPAIAAACDGVWLSTQLGLYVGLSRLVDGTTRAALSWTAGAILSLALAEVLNGSRFKWRPTRRALVESRAARISMGVEAATVVIINQLTPVVLAAVGGLSTTGLYRAALTLLGPATSIFTAVNPVVVRDVSRASTLAAASKRCLQYTAAMGLVCGLSVGLVYSLPRRFVVNIFGVNALAARQILPFAALNLFGLVLIAYAATLLRRSHGNGHAAGLRVLAGIAELASFGLVTALTSLQMALVVSFTVMIPWAAVGYYLGFMGKPHKPRHRSSAPARSRQDIVIER